MPKENQKRLTETTNAQRKVETPKENQKHPKGNQKHPKDTGSTQRKLGMAKRKLETQGKLETRKENQKCPKEIGNCQRKQEAPKGAERRPTETRIMTSTQCVILTSTQQPGCRPPTRIQYLTLVLCYRAWPSFLSAHSLPMYTFLNTCNVQLQLIWGSSCMSMSSCMSDQ